MAIAPSTTPELIGQQLIRSLKLYRTVFLRVVFLALMLSIIAFIPRLMILAIGKNIFATLPLFSPHKLWFVVIDLACLTFFTAILWRVRCILRGEHESLLSDFEIAIKKLPFILVAVIVQMLLFLLINFTIYGFYSYLGVYHLFLTTSPIEILIIILPFMLQMLISFFIFFLFFFYLPLILIENDSAIAALKQSAHLVWKHWWQTFWVQITPWVCYLLFLLILKFVAHINVHIYFFQPVQPTIIEVGVHILVFALFIPWAATTLLTQLHDLELRTPSK